MSASSRKILLVIVAVAVLGFVIYRSSGFINLAGFSGAKLWIDARNANPYYLALSLLGIYACYGLRARAGRCSRAISDREFLDDLPADPGRLRCNFSAGPRGRTDPTAAAGAQRTAAGCRHVRVVLSRAAVRHGVHGGHRRTRLGALRDARACNFRPRLARRRANSKRRRERPARFSSSA